MPTGCDLLQSQINEHKRAHEKEHELLERARVDSRDEMARRLDSMNEFRRQLERAEQSLMSREEWRLAHAALIDRVEVMGAAVDIRFRSLERLVYIGVGASGIIGAALHFVK